MIKVDRDKIHCHYPLQLKPRFGIEQIFLYLIPVNIPQYISYTLLHLKINQTFSATEVMKMPWFSLNNSFIIPNYSSFVFYFTYKTMYSYHLNNEHLFINIHSVI